jgi:flagellar motor protein MotB
MKREMIDASDPRVTLIGHPAPAWLVNYADLMTELVCFFVILYALSASLNKDVQEAKKETEEAMKQEQVQGEVKVDKEGMHITITEEGENVFFQSGSAEVSDRLKEVLAKISPPLVKLAENGHDIIVEGHTDDVPIRAKFASNWELSSARATSVVKYMIAQEKFPAKHMAAMGYGEFRPVAPNDSDENRAKNRRVVFFVKNKSKSSAEKKKEQEAKEQASKAAEAEATGPPAEAAPDEVVPTETTDEAVPTEAPTEETE